MTGLYEHPRALFYFLFFLKEGNDSVGKRGKREESGGNLFPLESESKTVFPIDTPKSQLSHSGIFHFLLFGSRKLKATGGGLSFPSMAAARMLQKRVLSLLGPSRSTDSVHRGQQITSLGFCLVSSALLAFSLFDSIEAAAQ